MRVTKGCIKLDPEEDMILQHCLSVIKGLYKEKVGVFVLFSAKLLKKMQEANNDNQQT